MPYVQALAVLLLAPIGIAVGQLAGRWGRRGWVVVYGLSITWVFAIAAATWSTSLHFCWPFSAIISGRAEYVGLAAAGALALGVLAYRLPKRRQQRAVYFFVGSLAIVFAMPFGFPALMAEQHRSRSTEIDEDGVCRQSSGYSCGAAASVTALRALGFEAEEGEIAALAYTTPILGTEPDLLAAALNRRYGGAGLAASYRQYETLAELRESQGVIAVVAFSLVVDHYVAVLDIGERDITVGDPLRGLLTYSHAEFEGIWRRRGIALVR